MRLQPFEAVLNRNIAASATARQLCRQLDGKVLALHVTGTPVSLFLRGAGERMEVDTTNTGVATATLSGTPLSLLRLAGARADAALRGGNVHIEGNAEVAQTFSELLKHTRPDLEEELSRVIGDVAAHQAGNMARSALAFGRRAADTFAQNVAEFLQEESRDLPTRTEADEFLSGVDKLRDDVDRVAARIKLLEQRARR
ncbi:MAG: SCP2 sterol-binding domain-containing protein [Steroidobacteraceae bacterium]